MMKSIISKCNLANEQTAAFYLALLSHTDDTISIPQKDLHNFFHRFYTTLNSEPLSLGMNELPKVCFENGEYHSKSKEFKRIKDKVIKPVSDFLDMLYMTASQGSIEENVIIGDKIYLDKFLKTGKRQKRKLIEGVANLGLDIIEDEDRVRIISPDNPAMVKALHILALKCSENSHEAGKICFYRCDFRALDTDYKPNIEDMYNKLYINEALQDMLQLHQHMQDNGFEVNYLYEPHVLNFEIRYTNKAIKSSPLIALTFDCKQHNPLQIRLRFIATSRITPIIQTQPLRVKEDFYRTSIQCSGCGWCKNQKGLLKPSVLDIGTDKKTICWYDVNQYDTLDVETISLIMDYIDMHLELVG